MAEIEVRQAELDIITEIPEELHFPCPCKVKRMDPKTGFAVLEPCGRDIRAIPKVPGRKGADGRVQHALPACETWEKRQHLPEFITQVLIAGGVAVHYAPDPRNYHGKPR